MTIIKAAIIAAAFLLAWGIFGWPIWISPACVLAFALVSRK